jgi:hypothetical protein
MILSGHAPTYLPGIQLFSKIALSDVFMHCGHLQYQSKSWHSHNFIRTTELIVPVHKTLGDQINKVKIADGRWRRKHIRSMEMAYEDKRKFPFFGIYFPRIRAALERDWEFLGDLNRYLTEMLLDMLGIRTRVVDSGRWLICGDAIEKIIAMCKAVGATHYLSNRGAEKYISYPQEEQMKEAGITHLWQDFTDPVYGQDSTMNGGRLSAVDPLFKFGGATARPLIEHSGRIHGLV